MRLSGTGMQVRGEVPRYELGRSAIRLSDGEIRWKLLIFSCPVIALGWENTSQWQRFVDTDIHGLLFCLCCLYR